MELRRRADAMVLPARMNDLQRLQLAKYRATAEAHGGRCLSRSYLRSAAKLDWVCALGHRWSALPSNIRKGHWCPTCGQIRWSARKRQQTLETVRALARKRGGRCLSREYAKGNTKLEFRCARGHRWSTLPFRITGGHWCQRCSAVARAQPTREKTFRSVLAIARRRGGRCLSTTYTNVWAKMRWRCAEGHEWEANAFQIRHHRTWCLRCAGIHRYTLDEMREVARRRGGECLSDLYLDVARPLRWRCRAGHTWWASASNVIRQGTWCPRCYGTFRDDLVRLRKIARRHGGQCLSTEYEGCNEPLLWRCRKGHEWWTKPCHIVHGSWCAICRRSGPRSILTLEDMQAMASERGGQCLSTTYFNGTTHMRWRCASGHEWEAIPASIRRGSWCPTCASTVRGTIEGLRAWAADRGGRCLSDTYDDARVPLRWQCENGHRFEALAKAVKSGTWCPRCGTRPAPRVEWPRRSRRARRPVAAKKSRAA